MAITRGERCHDARENTDSKRTERRGYGVQVDRNLRNEGSWRQLVAHTIHRSSERPEFRVEGARSDEHPP
jgi:hypothetical protein